jgi:ABC-type branched-subunit amino acid transport system substrate-binding protein
MATKWVRLRVPVLLTVVAVTTTLLAGASSAGTSVRGFDGSTITVASIGLKSQLGSGETGARARIKRFNDTNELKGVTIDYTELAEDNGDPATALSETRRLVTQTGVFALVGDISTVDPVEYLTQQRVPVFGGGFGPAYCSPTPTTKLWLFAVTGCFSNPNPSFVNDNYKTFYTYVRKTTGKKHPTMVQFSNDTASGKAGNKVFAVAATGAGFKVVSVQNKIPLGAVSDYTPYVQDIMTADDGEPPDATFCGADVQCLPLWQLLQAQGYQGVFGSGLYTDALVKPLEGSTTQFTGYNFNSDTPGMKQMKADLDAYEAGAGAKTDVGSFFGYASADFFIQVLKKVAAKGKSNITPENVQKVASTFTWELPGVAGPTKFPKSTVMGFPACLSAMVDDGTAWQTVVPYKCSTKTYSPNLKVG